MRPLDISSYRPIALTSCVVKLIRKMIYYRHELFYETSMAYLSSMAGFRHGRSSFDGVLDLVTSVQALRTRKCLTAAVSLDIVTKGTRGRRKKKREGEVEEEAKACCWTEKQ